MKKQLREKLRKESNAQLAQSLVLINHNNNNDRSLIHELGDFLEQENNHNEHLLLQNIKYLNKTKPNVLSSYNSTSGFNRYNSKNKNLDPYEFVSPAELRQKYNNFGSQRQRKKFQYKPTHQFYKDHLFSKNKSIKTKQKINKARFSNNDQQQLNILFDSPSKYTMEQQLQNDNFHTKMNYNRSNVLKYKQFIYNNLLSKCQHCKQPKSQIFYNNFVCRNKNCRILHMFENIKTFCISSLLYQIQFPSSSHEELQGLIKLINKQVDKIQQTRSNLIELQFYLQSIIESKKQTQKLNKNNLNDLTYLISQIKMRKYKDSEKQKQGQTQINNCIKKFEDIQLSKIYQQFSKWSQINTENYSQYKTITEMIHRFKPLCLKQLTSEMAQEISIITDNFSNTDILIRSSAYLSYNFNGNLNKMVLCIDGGTQDKLRRDNFLLIEKLQELQLVFECRRSSLQLRQLFNILPNCNGLKLAFDYKLNSNVNSQTFPLITKAFQLSEKSVQIKLLNARSQVFDDLIQVSKMTKNKQKVHISIEMNPFLSESQLPQCCKSLDWGTKVVKALIKNIGSKVTKIQLILPFKVNIEQICQYLINEDYYLLTQLKINAGQNQLENSQNIGKLLEKIIKKKNLLLGIIVRQKKKSLYPLKKHPILAQSVYQVLY